jgi:SAM-dependent methyltransferase
MIVTQKPPVGVQACPLCEAEQDVIIQGWINTTKEDGTQEQSIQKDRGYSFCNCRNIFFTEFNENFSDIYTGKYVSKYDNDHAKKLLRNYSIYLKTILDMRGNNRSPRLLEIGAATDVICEEGSKMGMWCTAFDIAERDSKFPMITGNFETFDFDNRKFDIIFASHIFEHFRDPIATLKKCHDLLNDGGFLFVAMPDPWFIDYANPYMWGHWHVDEHHILWDKDSFCNVARETGFDVIMSQRNVTTNFICLLDMHLMFRKPLPFIEEAHDKYGLYPKCLEC